MAQARLTLDLDALSANWRALDAKSADHVETAAVVKADGYGTGAIEASQALYRAGVRSFFVATIEEAIALPVLEGSKIYVFGGYMDGDQDAYATNNVIPMLNSSRQFRRFRNDFPERAFGLQLDSGMNRLGLEPDDLANLDASAQNAVLVMSHLACADEPNHPMNARQLAQFLTMTDGRDFRRSLSATGGILLGPEYHFDLTRPGIGLYGGLPFDEAAPVAKIDLPIIQTREVLAGETVGYGNKWKARRDSIVATVSSGYADGIIRAIGNGKVQLYANGVACPLIGRVSMDLITVDVSEISDLPKSLSLLNQAQTVDDLAEAAETIGYEILTSLGARYQRYYVGG